MLFTFTAWCWLILLALPASTACIVPTRLVSCCHCIRTSILLAPCHAAPMLSIHLSSLLLSKMLVTTCQCLGIFFCLGLIRFLVSSRLPTQLQCPFSVFISHCLYHVFHDCRGHKMSLHILLHVRRVFLQKCDCTVCGNVLKLYLSLWLALPSPLRLPIVIPHVPSMSLVCLSRLHLFPTLRILTLMRKTLPHLTTSFSKLVLVSMT